MTADELFETTESRLEQIRVRCPSCHEPYETTTSRHERVQVRWSGGELYETRTPLGREELEREQREPDYVPPTAAWKCPTCGNITLGERLLDFLREITLFEVKRKPIVRYHILGHFGDKQTEYTSHNDDKDKAVEYARMVASAGVTEVSVERVTTRVVEDREEIDWRDEEER
jgi:hypothetical protein